MLVIVLLASTAAIGCITVNPTLTPTAGPLQTATPTIGTATPQPAGGLPLNFKKYETGTTPAFIANQVSVSHPFYYMRDDLEMPMPSDGLNPARHGVIHELDFWNPTPDNKTIHSYYFLCNFIELYDGNRSYISAQQTFYYPDEGSFSVFTLKPHERRTIYIYAYIPDKYFDEYHGMFQVGSITMIGSEYYSLGGQ